MTLPAWPSELPQRLTYTTYSETLRDTRFFTNVDAGFGRMRRRLSVGILKVSISFPANFDKKTRFERFWTEETEDGTKHFSMPGQGVDGISLLDEEGGVLLMDDDSPAIITHYWRCRFGQGGPEITRQAGIFRINFDVDVLT